MRDTGPRGTASPTPEPGRFRCLVCRKVVTGTPSGHCPQCGFVPPTSIELPRERPSGSPVWLVTIVVLAIALALAVLLT